MSLENIKIGDYVIANGRLLRVSRITPKQFECLGGGIYRKSDGREVGGDFDGWHNFRGWARLATQEDIDIINKEKAEEEKTRIRARKALRIKSIDPGDYERLPDDAFNEIEELLKKHGVLR